MKISVAVIAHNEERHIKECLDSLLSQTRKADEIIVVAHNCTDGTAEIARQFPVTLIEYHGPEGIVPARMRGLEAVTGDIILCIDGDSYASPNWIAEMSGALHRNGNVLVGSYIRLIGTMLAQMNNPLHKFQARAVGKLAQYWIWGSSIGFWGRDKKIISEILERSSILSKEVGLPRNPDDYWLAVHMALRGNIEVINSTMVTNYVKEESFLASLKRQWQNNMNALKIWRFLKHHPDKLL